MWSKQQHVIKTIELASTVPDGGIDSIILESYQLDAFIDSNRYVRK